VSAALLAGGNNGGGGECGRVRVAGRLNVRGGDADLSASSPSSSSSSAANANANANTAAPIVTLQSPLFLQGPCELVPAGPVGDNDWMDEGVYRCKLRRVDTDTTEQTQTRRLDQEVTVVVRGVSPGETPRVRLTCSAGGRLELQGGSISLQGGALSWARGGGGGGGEGGDLEFEGTLDVTPGVMMGFDGAASRLACLGGAWPWQQ
jgi:hypothetical protein